LLHPYHQSRFLSPLYRFLPIFFLLLPPPPTPTLFPYTTLFRSTTRRVAAKFGSSLPRSSLKFLRQELERLLEKVQKRSERIADLDRKSTRLNSSHLVISYAVFCLKKKKKKE